MKASIRTLLTFIIVLLLFPMVACALSGEAIMGKVMEEGTNKPIANAIVIVRWSGHLATFAHGKTVCYHVLSSTTDETGVYRFPAWRKKITEDWQKNISPEAVIITAYKPGYEEYLPRGYASTEAFKRNIRYLKPDTGVREERLKVIRTASVSCGSAGESQKNLLPLYQTLYEEARALAVTKQNKQVVNALLHQIDMIELPYAEVLKRDDERYKALQKESPNE